MGAAPTAARQGISSASAASSRAPRSSSHCPNSVRKATTGRACKVVAISSAPAMITVSTSNQTMPMTRAHSALARARTSKRRRSSGASPGASAIAARPTSVRNTSVPNSDTSAATCVPRNDATMISTWLMPRLSPHGSWAIYRSAGRAVPVTATSLRPASTCRPCRRDPSPAWRPHLPLSPSRWPSPGQPWQN